MKLTAGQGTTLRDGALAAQEAVTTAAVELNTIGDAWQTAYEKLVGVMRELIKNLEGKLAKDDPRWLAFGLKMPATSVTPGQPVNVTVQLDETGALVVQCEAVALAKRYRWRTRIAGVQDDFQLVARTTEPLAVIREVMAGQTVEVIVQAVNVRSQGVASEPVFFTLPVARAAGYRNLSTTEEEPAATESASIQANGNGNGRARHTEARSL